MAIATNYPSTQTLLTNNGHGWINTGFFLGSQDNKLATCSLAATNLSDVYKLTNYGFNIPNNSTINHIDIIVRCSTSVSGGVRATVTLYSPTATGSLVITSGIPTSIGNVTFTDSQDLWSLILAASDINSSGFGVSIKFDSLLASGSVTASVDNVGIQVNYTPPSVSSFVKYINNLSQLDTLHRNL